VTGASGRNWSAYGAQVELDDGASALERAILTDPQTSGGLLVACAPAAVPEVLACFRAAGFAHAGPIGRLVEGAPQVRVRGRLH
jgi:selenide,water dikinase